MPRTTIDALVEALRKNGNGDLADKIVSKEIRLADPNKIKIGVEWLPELTTVCIEALEKDKSPAGECCRDFLRRGLLQPMRMKAGEGA